MGPPAFWYMLCYLDLSQLCLGTLYHPSITRRDSLTAPKQPETSPKPTYLPLSTSNLTSVQSYHCKNNYAITRPTSAVSRHTISPICEQGGSPHSPKPTDFPLSTSNVISVQSYHSKNDYAITMLSRPSSTVSRHTISLICDQGGPP